MDQIFAPWRMEWVSRQGWEEVSNECVFCEIYKKGKDRELGVIAENEYVYVVLNNYPYNPGHVMVIPKEHTGSYAELNEEVLFAHSRLKVRTLKALETAFSPHGFNTGLNLGKGSGGSINEHMHTHIVPRWEGDTNFMPILSDTKIVVEGMLETYLKLHDAFVQQNGTEDRGEEKSVWVGE